MTAKSLDGSLRVCVQSRRDPDSSVAWRGFLIALTFACSALSCTRPMVGTVVVVDREPKESELSRWAIRSTISAPAPA